MNREELLQIAKPILFSTPMTIAILENRKGATRRIVKPQPPENLQFPYGFITGSSDKKEIGKFCWTAGEICDGRTYTAKPRYKAGDILYVRETWKPAKKGYSYRADWERDGIGDIRKWKPSIHMPKEAARIFLKVTNMGVERAQDITEEQAIKEGVGDSFLDYIANCPGDKYKVPMEHETLAIDQFELLWDSTIKKQNIDKYGWDANPWVFAYEFERVVPSEK